MFGDNSWADLASSFITGVVGAVVTLGGAIIGWRILWKKTKLEVDTAKHQLNMKEQAQQVKIKRDAERQARDEYRDLFNEVKAELGMVRREHRDCERKLARVEAALIAANIPLPELQEHDTDEHTPLPRMSPQHRHNDSSSNSEQEK